MDVSDQVLKNHPEFLAYLDSLTPAISFTKAASYLMHGNNFSKIREKYFGISAFIMQDDSGAPYKAFTPTLWDVTLYGRYTKTIKDFGETIQSDLAKAYASEVERALPFRFGYHWWDGHSNIQVAKKKE